MSFSVILYTFKKAANSTAQPTESTLGYPATGVLKNGCSLLTPEIGFDFGSAAFNPTSFNYADIETFGRYYNITDWYYEDRLWYATMACDVLASWKGDIGSSSQYVLRSSYTKNGDLEDTMYPAQSTPTVSTINQSIYSVQSDYGTYVLAVANGETQGSGATALYAFTETGLYQFFRTLLSMNTFSQTEISEELAKMLFNPIQYIVSLRWYPFPISNSYTEDKTSIRFGWWDLPVRQCRGIISWDIKNGYVREFNYTLPNHPQISRGSYLNRAPYTKVTLHLAPYGDINIPCELIQADRALHITQIVDVLSGDSVLRVETGKIGTGSNAQRAVIVTAKATLGVEMPVSQATSDIIGAGVSAISAATYSAESAIGVASGVASAVGGALTLSPGSAARGAASAVTSLTSGLRNVAASVGDALKYAAPSADVRGSTGAFGEIIRQPNLQIVCEFYNVSDDDNSKYGRPLCQVKTISSIPGFIKTSHAKISSICTADERTAIESFMDAGFFYE